MHQQVNNMDVLAIEDMQHVDVLEFNLIFDQQFWQTRELTKRDSQLQALKETILAGWPITKDESENGHMVIQRQIGSSHWGYLQRKPCHHSKSTATRNANKNPCIILGAETCLTKARDAIYWPTINFEGEDFISNLLHTMITCKAVAKNH